jgi:hypothetical protein
LWCTCRLSSPQARSTGKASIIFAEEEPHKEETEGFKVVVGEDEEFYVEAIRKMKNVVRRRK